MSMLSYIPFVYPLQSVYAWWYVLLIPLALGISVVWKAIRVPDFNDYWRQVVAMTIQIVLAMIGLALLLALFVQVVIPRLPVDMS
ncbi:MAG: hypothetical protein AAF432_15985 [Planctomycetota bacterium]